MNTRKLIIFTLFFSYSLILSHGIIHHDHHETDHCLNSNKIFSNHDHCQNSDFNLHDFFNNYSHTGSKQVFTPGSFNKLVKISSNKFQTAFLLKDNLDYSKPPPYLFLKSENSKLNTNKILFSYKGLRAPPLA